MSKIMQLIKGESSFWINQERIIGNQKFEWQDEYYAISVDESRIDSVREYIKKQEEHHSKNNFQEESKDFPELPPFLNEGPE